MNVKVDSDETPGMYVSVGVCEYGTDHQCFPIDMKMLTTKAPALAEHLKDSVKRCGIGRLTGVPAPVVESALRFLSHQELSFEVKYGLALMDFCRKFALEDVLDAVLKSFIQRLDAPTALSLLPVMYRLPEKLSQRAFMLVDTKAEQALKSDAFLQLGSASVISPLKRCTLDIDEASLFRHVERWILSSAELYRSANFPSPEFSETATDDDRSKTIRTILSLFRYRWMAREDFDAGPALLMNTEDLASVNRWLSGGGKPDWCIDVSRIGRGQSVTCSTTEWAGTSGTAKTLTLRLSPDGPLWIAGLHTCIWGTYETAEIVGSRWYTMAVCLKNCTADLSTSSALKVSAKIELPHFRNSVRVRFQSLPSSEKYGDAGLIKQIIVHPPMPRRLKQFPPKQSSSSNHLQSIAATVKRAFK